MNVKLELDPGTSPVQDSPAHKFANPIDVVCAALSKAGFTLTSSEDLMRSNRAVNAWLQLGDRRVAISVIRYESAQQVVAVASGRHTSLADLDNPVYHVGLDGTNDDRFVVEDYAVDKARTALDILYAICGLLPGCAHDLLPGAVCDSPDKLLEVEPVPPQLQVSLDGWADSIGQFAVLRQALEGDGWAVTEAVHVWKEGRHGGRTSSVRNDPTTSYPMVAGFSYVATKKFSA